MCKYSLGERYRGICFSRQEAECALHMLRGRKKLDNIADKLGLMPDTVAFIINNMMRKLHCDDNKELLSVILDSDLLGNIDFA